MRERARGAKKSRPAEKSNRLRSVKSGRDRASYHHGNLRAALIAAALHILQTEGVAALTLRGAARAAGVSQAAPYRHFADKEALLAAVAEEGFHALSAAVEVAVQAVGSEYLLRFRAQGAAYVRFAVEHPAQFRLMFGGDLADHSKHPGLKAAADRTFEDLVAAVQGGHQAGMIRNGVVLDQAMAAWSMVHGLSSLLVDGQLSSEGEALEEFGFRVLQYLFVGLRHETIHL